MIEAVFLVDAVLGGGLADGSSESVGPSAIAFGPCHGLNE